MPRGTTPLLTLLDELLPREDGVQSQQQQGVAIKTALDEMNGLLQTVGKSLPPLFSVTCPTTADVVAVLTVFLGAFPEQAHSPSTHDGSLPLHFAASVGDVTIASTVLQFYPQAAATPNRKGKLPLHYAAREGRLEMVRFFMNVAPHTAAIASKKDKLALHFAAGEGHVAIVQSLLSAYPRGASLPSAKGKVPLHFASRWGHIPIANDLLYIFPDAIRTLDWDGSLPLHEATREGQYHMARYLAERFPPALATSNLRGDIPLFPAVRSGNLDLITYLIRVWPEGGQHVLQSITEDDCSSDWLTPVVMELLLRGAVDNFEGCELLQNRDPPNLRLVSALHTVPGQPCDDQEGDESCACISEKRPKFADVAIPEANLGDTIEHRMPRVLEELKHQKLPSTPTQSGDSQVQRYCRKAMRSKSPTLDEQEDADCRKRVKSCHNCCEKCRLEGDCCGKCISSDAGAAMDLEGLKLESANTFIPLHAALLNDASADSVSFILDCKELCNNNIFEEDSHGCNALHHAIRWAKSDARKGKIVLERIFAPFPQAAAKSDQSTSAYSFPLWDAIAVNSPVELITALIQAYPPAATKADSAANKPVEMACYRRCDLSTVYQLLRVDPSFLETKKSSKI